MFSFQHNILLLLYHHNWLHQHIYLQFQFSYRLLQFKKYSFNQLQLQLHFHLCKSVSCVVFIGIELNLIWFIFHHFQSQFQHLHHKCLLRNHKAQSVCIATVNFSLRNLIITNHSISFKCLSTAIEVAQPIAPEPCETDVLEPTVYVAPPPAPALLDLPPVVKRMCSI